MNFWASNLPGWLLLMFGLIILALFWMWEMDSHWANEGFLMNDFRDGSSPI